MTQIWYLLLMAWWEFMFYEQPLNEQVRLCLRLEYLFNQTDYYLTKESTWDLHQMLKIILEILQTTDRPDIKNKFAQTLNQYAHTLSQLEKLPDIDKQKLNDTLKQIDYIIDNLHNNPKKIGQELRENEFLSAIQQRLYTPAGTCSFSLPSYHLWLHHNHNLCQKQLSIWLKNFSELQETVDIILKLLRESAQFKTCKTNGGFYHTNLDPNISYQLIRIKINQDKNIFPEISIGKYRLAIHFFNLDINGNQQQTSDSPEFELACCRI